MAASSKKVAFKNNVTSDSDTESDNDFDTVTASKKSEPEYYDPIYFDSDSDFEDDQVYTAKREQRITEPLDNLSGVLSPNNGVAEITEELKSSSLDQAPSPAAKGKRVRKHPTISDSELLYDPDEDDRDENWLIKKIAENRPPGCKPEDIWTDAILACPMCLTQLCYDCQRHEIYVHQYRAMFVEHCKTIETEILRFAVEKKKRGKKAAESAETPSSSSGISEPEFRPSEYDEPEAVYHPVVCEVCNTKVALIDGDEVYHFFNVIPSPV
ncbi:hypothetical protein BG004_006070 [Podila humilis]|nr:hypothetical protein BG004_006070 [Podila humilis]